jgi:nucleotide-binding universal stress UspA family protein
VPTSPPLAPPRPGSGPAPGRAGDDRGAAAATASGGRPVREVAVGVDGGECALSAVRWAAEEAARRDAPLRIVHAAPYLGRRLNPGTVPPELPRARRITGQAYTVARHTGRTVTTETEVVPGEPTSVLLRAAAGAQLLVVGISTTGVPDELVLAPVAQRVVARSTTPVVVVPRSRGPSPAGRPVVGVLGLGDPDDDEPVAEFAAAAAGRSGAPLLLLRTRGGAELGAGRWPDLDVTERALPTASPAAVLEATCPAPLLVLSAGHGSLLHRMLDRQHRYLLRHCTSPMAMVPPVHRPENEPREQIIAVG